MTRSAHNSPPEVPEHTLLRQIGRGAYGEVWLARNALGTYRAAKIIHRSQFDHDRPYERELNAIREVEPITRQHEGLVDILQVGEREDYFYYIMELADDIGEESELDPETYQPRTLTLELYKRERLSVEGVCALGATIARALAFLHEHNLVHRDVKLSNIIYVNGRAKLADVGLVTRSDESFSLVGTYGYIPREGPGRPPADIYALGKVLYESATGKDRADFPEIDVMDPALKGLNRVFLKACAEEPEARYLSAGDMVGELEKLIQNDEAETTASTSSSAYKTGALAASLMLILALIFYSKDDKPASAGNNTSSSDSSLDEEKETVATDFVNEGLVAYYPFNGNAKDESGNGNDGTAANVEFVEEGFGPDRKAGKFVNGSRVVVSARDFPAGNAPRTLTCFVKVLDHPGGTNPNTETYICGYGSQKPNAAFSLYGDTFNEQSSATSNGWFSWSQWGGGVGVSAENEAELGKWYMLAVTYDGASVKTYLDGEFYQAKPFNLTTDISAPFNIGQWDFRRYTIGLIDEVRLYNRALKAAEVKALYDLEKSRPFVWDFAHEYKTVNDPAVNQYLQGKDNAITYVEEESGACYWTVETGGKRASVTYKYSFDREIKKASLKATLETYNFGRLGYGHSSIWVSRDGEKWEEVLDGPAPQLPPGREAQGANYQIHEAMPESVLGGSELWVQARMESPDSPYGPIFGQFSRAGTLHEGNIYSLKVKLGAKKIESTKEISFSKGLVAYYPFDDKAKDESGNGNDGDLKGAKPCEDRFGRPAKAYRFDGLDDVIRVPDSDMLDLGTNSAGEVTVSIWFKGDIQREGWLLGKATQSGSPYTDYGILASRFHEYRFHGFVWGTGLSAAVGGSDSTDWMAVKSDAGPDQWHHLLAVYGGSDSEVPGKKVYIDGKLVAEAGPGARKNKANGGPLGIGGVGSQGPNWKGEIDDVRIYNRALSGQQVKALYDFEKPKPKAGKPVKPSVHPTPESVQGIYAYKNTKTIFRKNGIAEGFRNGVKEVEYKWEFNNKEVALLSRTGETFIFRIEPNGDLTRIAVITDGRRGEYSIKVTSKKIALKKGLVAYYPFNGNAKDESGNGNDGVIEGVEFDQGIGEDGKAAKFNGAGSRIKFATKALPSGNDPVTMSLFVKITGALTNSTEEFHIGRGDPPQSFFGFFGNHLPGMPQDKIHYRFTNWATHTDFKTVKRDEWNSLVVTHDGTTLITYVNGEKVESKPYTLQTAGDTLFVGQRGDDPYRKTVGMVDQLRIYNRALSTEEVKALYDLEKPKSSPEDSLTKGLVAYYPFNGNAKDESTNSNDFTVKGATLAKGRNGNADSAYAFNGNAFMEAPNDPSLQLTEFTVSMWINPIEWVKNTALLMKDEHAGGENYGMWLNDNDGPSPKLSVYSAEPKPGGGYFGDGIISPKTVRLNEYSMLTGTYSEKKLRLYLNGELAVSKETETPPRGSERPLFLGYDGGFQNDRYNKFNGTMDDVRIYNRALSTEEVAALYDLEKPKSASKKEAAHTETSIKPYEFDKNTVLLEHFEGSTTGKSNRPVSYDKGRIGQGLRLTPKTFLSWDKGPLAEGTYEFWFKLDEEKYSGTLASTNFLGLPAAVTIIIKLEEKLNVYSELFTHGPEWNRPKYIENKIRAKQWNHVAVSWGQKGINTYLNGVRIGFLEGTHLLSRQTGTWVMGASIRSAAKDGFAGVIDEVRISNVQREFKPEDFTP